MVEQYSMQYNRKKSGSYTKQSVSDVHHRAVFLVYVRFST